jgi:hypothetical protein
MNRIIKLFASCFTPTRRPTRPAHPALNKAYRLHLEGLESRDLLSVYSVGRDQTYTDLWQVPWDSLSPRDQVLVYWQPHTYHSKIDINTSGIAIIGIPGPDGQLPVLDANGAQENSSANYFTNQIASEGLITIAPTVYNGVVNNVLIQGLELKRANQDSYFYDANGNLQWYDDAAAGVAMYMAQNITIKDCIIHDNGNGIFGKSYGYDGGDLAHIRVIGNDIWGNGVVGSFLEHNTYIEGWFTLYEFNYYGPLRDGAEGVGLKDRSVAPVIAYNYFEGGSYLLDLVDPDDGAGDMVGDPGFGPVWVYGNVLVNPEGGASSLVHFGFDQVAADAQQTLYFYDNTVVNYNSVPDGRYYTYVLKIDGGGTAYVFDNVFDSVSPEGEWAGNFYLATSNYGTGIVFVGVNAAPSGMQPGDEITVGWENMILADDVGFVDVLGSDFRLNPDSPATGVAQGIYGADGFVDEVGLPAAAYQYDFADGGGWTDRPATTNLGVWESDP